MNIRKRLISFLMLTMILLLAMGSLMFVGGPIIVNAFRQSMEAMNSLNSIRELRGNYQKQLTALNQYLIVGNTQEILTIQELTERNQEILDLIKSQYSRELPTWLETTIENHDKSLKVQAKVLALYEKGLKSQAFDVATNDFFPQFQILTDSILQVENREAEAAQFRFNAAQTFSEKVTFIIGLVILTAFIFGFLLIRNLYKAILVPLENLRTGAEEFGKGHWDYKIAIPEGNEFAVLAKSFHNMAENVKTLQQQAIHMDRMSAVGQLAGGVAHEINNPLTGVLGQAQILLAKINEDAPSYKSLKKIEQAALRCKKIVRGLLDFSRPSQTKFEDLSANEILLATLDLCEADIKSTKVNVVRKFTEKLPPIAGNASELQQVLLNLINNALQAMPRGGSLTIETITHNRSLTLRDRRKNGPPQMAKGSWVEIIVRDSGVGISREHLGRVFEPFFTTKEIGKGTGLGLSVSMGIVRKHGGDLRVESQGINRGASFHMVLPVKGSLGFRSFNSEVPEAA